jgi:CBS domain-containing protein
MYGDARLAAKMQSHILIYSDTHPDILRAMLSNTLRHKIVLNVFGQLLVEPYGEFAGCVDVKYGGYIPIINSIRLYAILAGVVETSSHARLNALWKSGELSEQQYRDFADALSTMLYLRDRAPHELVDGHYVTSGMVKLKQLDPQLRMKLKIALKTGRKLQRLIEKKVGLPK